LNPPIKEALKDRSYLSPVGCAIQSVAICRVTEAIPELLSIIEYEVDRSSLPVGDKVGEGFFFSAASALVELRVSPETIIEHLAKEQNGRRRHLLTWVLVQRVGDEKKAKALLAVAKKEKKFAGKDAQANYTHTMKLLAKEVRLPKLSPSGKVRYDSSKQKLPYVKQHQAWQKQYRDGLTH
jgi:hypothetical protein